MATFKVGDYVRVENGVRLQLDGKPLSEYIGEVEKVSYEVLFIKFNGFKYTAPISQCKKVTRVKNI